MEGAGSMVPSQVCLFCVNEELAEVKKEDNEIYNGDNRIISSQLKSIFVLRHLLGLPVEKLCEYLAENGGTLHPNAWFAVCSNCDVVVEQCFTIHQELLRLKEKIGELSRTLKEKIEETYEEGQKRREERRRSERIWFDIRNHLLERTLCNDSGVACSPGPTKTEDKSLTRKRSRNKRSLKKTVCQEESPDHDLGDLLGFLGIEPPSPQNVSPYSSACDSEGSEWQPSDNGSCNLKKLNARKTDSELNSKISQRQNLIGLQSKTPVASKAGLKKDSSCTKRRRKKPQRRLPNKFQYIYKCEKCPAYTLNSKLKLEAHRVLHENGKGVPCPECGWMCESRDNLRRHISFRHFLKSGRPSKRTVTVSRKYPNKTKKQVDKHIIPFDVMQYNCDHCETRFSKTCWLINHVDSSHKDKPQVSCDICKIKLASKQLLEMHVKSKHWHLVKQEKELKNDSSILNSDDQTERKRHFSPNSKSNVSKSRKRKKLETEKETYQCELCPGHFATVAQLGVHHEVHQRNDSVPCLECGWVFETEPIMKKHIAFMHHEKSEMQPKKRGRKPLDMKTPKKVNVVDEKPYSDSTSTSAREIGERSCTRRSTRSRTEAKIQNCILSDVLECPDWYQEVEPSPNVSLNSPSSEGSDWQPSENEIHLDKMEEEEVDINEAKLKEDETQNISSQSKTPVEPKEELRKESSCTKRRRKRLKSRSCALRYKYKYIYKCEKCPAYFLKTKAKLEAHRKLHENGNGVPCSECGWVYENHDSVRRHISIRHYLKPQRSSKRTVTKKLSKMKKQVRKKIIQLAETPFYCDYCEMIYTTQGRLVRHVISNHKEELPVSCEICKTELMSKQLLEMHMKSEHGEATKQVEKQDSLLLNNDVQRNTNESESWLCPYCSKTFLTKMKVDFHIAKFHLDKLLTCKTCGFCSPSYSHLKTHEQTHLKLQMGTEGLGNSGNKKINLNSRQRSKELNKRWDRRRLLYFYNCNLCPAHFDTNLLLGVHHKIHENCNGVPCPKCGWVLEKEDEIKTHIANLHCVNVKPGRPLKEMGKKSGASIMEKEIPFYCDFCEMICTSRSKLVYHVSKFHKDQQLASCNLCPSKLASKQLLEMHLESEHEQRSKRGELDSSLKCNDEKDTTNHSETFPCPHCSKVFATKLKKDFHIAKFHSKYFLICKTCGLKTGCYSNLILHQQTHKEVQQKDFVCELCSKQFRHIEGLKYHKQQRHYKELGLEPILCNQCGAVHGSQQALEYHMKYKHAKTKEHCCEFCGKAFKWATDLKKHTLLHTAPKERHYKQGPFTCEFCQAQFNVRQGLYYHLKRLHSDKYDFRCEMCGKGYSVQNSLIAHQKSCKGQ